MKPPRRIYFPIRPREDSRDYRAFYGENSLAHSIRRKTSPETLERKRIRREIAVKYRADWLASHPCVDCGESDPDCLEFDHVRGEKHGTVGQFVILERLIAEIEKCDIRCCNCHAKRHARLRREQAASQY